MAPLQTRSSFGNTPKQSSISSHPTKRRSSFLSRNSSVEQIAFADPKEHEAYYNDSENTTPRASPPTKFLGSASARGLAQKPSLNALTLGRPRDTTPRPRAVRSIASFQDSIREEQATPRKPSFRVSDVSMAEQDVTVEVGDAVDVPAGMTGTVRFVGSVKGKKGVFAGIELDREFASRGKNDGDVEGTKYFSTAIAGAGIFLPAHRATKLSSPAAPNTGSNFPPTPTTPSYTTSLDLNKSARASSQSPQTPSISKFGRSVTGSARPNFSQTVGPGATRAVSPQLRKPASRPSLPRPESPARKTPSAAASNTRVTQSLRGGRPPGITPDPKSTFSASTNTRTPGATRSPSRTTSRNAYRSPDANDTPTVRKASTSQTTRAPSQTRAPAARPTSTQEEKRLRLELESRDKQLRDQAKDIAEMEASLAEIQSMNSSQKMRTPSSSSLNTLDSDTPVDVNQLRGLLREKNEKIAALTAEFDAHRADFRSTIDTLEMASTETERVYEKRVQDLEAELEAVNGGDVEQVASQLKSMEEFVVELEEGLETARRSEAEARAEVEFLHGEVDRVRTELRREREKAANALRGAGAAVEAPSTPGGSNSGHVPDSRDDEIRGLKAIIHSLSSNPAGSPVAAPNGVTPADSTTELASIRRELDAARRERGELQGLIDRKSFREEELEREIASLKLTGGRGLDDPTPKRNHADSTASARTAYRPGSGKTHDVSDYPMPSSSSSNNNKSRTGSGRLGSGGLNGVLAGSRPGTSQSNIPDDFEDAEEEMQTPPARALPVPTLTPKMNGDVGALGEGPAPGRSSKMVDMTRWCALCERDGHDSVDCPFEEF